MKKNFYLIVFLFLCNISLFSQEYILKFKVNSKDEIKKLTNIISIDNVNADLEVTAYANQKEFDEFNKLGYYYQILPHPSHGKSLTMATTVAQMSSWDRYPTHSVYLQMMYNFATNYPNICKIDTLGYSEAGRIILVAKITDNPDANEQEPEFYYTGQMHGDEIVDYILFLRLIDYLLSSYGTDTRVTNLINNYEIWINPLSNPDGTYSGGDNTVSGATRYNSNNVDLNRNFPSPTLPNPSGQNENEIQMQIAFAEAHHFVMSANTHSGAELVNFPWDSWTSSERTHADHDWWYHVSRNYADEVHLNAPSTYMDAFDNGVTHGGDWYVVSGSRQDHMGWYQHCREVTLELSNEKMLDCELLPNHWTYNRDAMLGYIEECMYGFNGTVKNINGDPLNAKIEISSHDFDNSEVYTDPVNGDYYRPIEPGTYNVTYSSEGYISQTHSVTVTAWETTTIKNVVLLQSAQASLSGTVIDATTGLPLENVEISFPETSITDEYTDANGEYSLTLAENEYSIVAYKNGYVQVTKTETLTGNNNIVDFALLPSDAITFEDEVPAGFTYSGDINWFRSNTDSYEGDYSMQSGDISDNETSVLTYTATTEAGNISFYKKVSCEDDLDDDWDYLVFKIDGTEKDRWDGEVDWSQESYAINAGSHTFSWSYIKDGSQSVGSDCAWVDYIELPADAPSSYNVTFTILDESTSNPIENADVNLIGYGLKSTNTSGQCVFNSVYETSETLDYSVTASGYNSANGQVSVSGNTSETVYLNDNVNVTEINNFVNIYPNPCNGSFNLEINSDEAYVFIYDSKGVEIDKFIINSNLTNINLEYNQKGVYFVKCVINNNISIQKLVIK